MRRVLLDGEFFADWSASLEELARFSGLSEQRLSFEEDAERDRELFKRERAQAVESITVTTVNGWVFDGDEISQGRMARAIIGLEAVGAGATVRWVLHDNTAVQVGSDDLREALALAGQAQADLWVQE